MAKKKSVTEAEQVQAAQEPALLPGEAVQEVQTDAPPMPEPARDESPCQEAPAAEDTQEEDGAAAMLGWTGAQVRGFGSFFFLLLFVHAYFFQNAFDCG